MSDGMKQCETCINREYKDKLLCCSLGRLGFAVREAFKSIPIVGEDIPDFECHAYMDQDQPNEWR